MAGELNIELCRYTNEIKLPEEVKGKKKEGSQLFLFPHFPLNKKKNMAEASCFVPSNKSSAKHLLSIQKKVVKSSHQMC